MVHCRGYSRRHLFNVLHESSCTVDSVEEKNMKMRRDVSNSSNPLGWIWLNHLLQLNTTRCTSYTMPHWDLTISLIRSWMSLPISTHYKQPQMLNTNNHTNIAIVLARFFKTPLAYVTKNNPLWVIVVAEELALWWFQWRPALDPRSHLDCRRPNISVHRLCSHHAPSQTHSTCSVSSEYTTGGSEALKQAPIPRNLPLDRPQTVNLKLKAESSWISCAKIWKICSSIWTLRSKATSAAVLLPGKHIAGTKTGDWAQPEVYPRERLTLSMM